MLSQNGTVNFEVNLEFAIPLKLRSTYKNFEFRAKASSYRVFEAEACDSKEKHRIRVFDRSPEFLKKDTVSQQLSSCKSYFISSPDILGLS